MEEIDLILNNIKNLVWAPPLLIFLIGTGVYLSILLKGMQIRYLLYALKQAFSSQKNSSAGDISQFQALMTSLAGAIGTGTIVGVATAITVGGLGAIFWMWVMAILGMAIKYAESLLAVKFREMDARGEMMGGPMQYIERGLGWRWMAILFAIFGAIAAIGTGNLVQVNAIAEAIDNVLVTDPWITGVITSACVGVIIVGGVRSIGKVSAVLVPIMAVFYLTAGLIIIIIHIDKVPAALMEIVVSAFQGQAAAGGFLGASAMMAIQMGVARSVFSNEAGLGISSMAAAAAKTDCPGRQAMITMTGALLSTIVVCSVTGLVLAVTGVMGQTTGSGKALTGASMAIQAFNSTLWAGDYIVSIGLILFAFTTVIAWAYYGEKCFEYLFGVRSVIIYRVLYTLIVIPGAALKMEVAWYMADIMNGLMVIPNLIAVIALSGVIKAETHSFLQIVKREQHEKYPKSLPDH
ncbi:MAG: sodium:alanine symporter family protein [Parachlamydiaceae bacterium]